MLEGGTAVGTLEECFHYYDQPGIPAIIENKLGKGTAILMTAAQYPGSNAVYPTYRFMGRELLRAGVANAKVQVCAPASVRYSVYPDGTVYLLNTDYDCTLPAKVLWANGTREVSLAPLQLLRVDTGVSV